MSTLPRYNTWGNGLDTIAGNALFTIEVVLQNNRCPDVHDGTPETYIRLVQMYARPPVSRRATNLSRSFTTQQDPHKIRNVDVFTPTTHLLYFIEVD